MSERVIIYTTKVCPYCIRAKALLVARGISFREVDVEGNDAERKRLLEVTGRKTVPQIFIDGKPIGGCDDLYELDRKGQLASMLAGPAEAGI